MAQPVYTQLDCAFYNDGTESGSTLISGGNIIVGNTGAEDKSFDTIILFRAVIGVTSKDGSDIFVPWASKNSGAYDTLGNISGISFLTSSNITQGGDTTQRLGSGTFVTDNNGIGNGGATGTVAIPAGQEAEVLWAIAINESLVSDGDTFDIRVYNTANQALDGYTETLRITVDKALGSITATLSKTLGALTSSGAGDVRVDGSLAKTLASLGIVANNLVSGEILTVDHETGDESEYDTSSDTDTAVSAAAAMMFSGYGLAVTQTAGTNFNQVFFTGALGTQYLRYRFYLDPNSIAMNTSDEFNIMSEDLDGTWSGFTIGGDVQLTYNGTSYQIRIRSGGDASRLNGTYYNITDGPHCIEVLASRETSDGAADGYYTLWIDNVLQGSITGVENYNVFSTLQGLNVGTSINTTQAGAGGTYYVDEIIVRNDDTRIGAGIIQVADFEEGDTTDIDATGSNGTYGVSTGSAMAGTYGSYVTLDADTAADSINLVDWAIPIIDQIRLGFYFDPNSITMADGDWFVMLLLQNDNNFVWGIVGELYYDSTGGTYQIRMRLKTDEDTYVTGALVDIADQPQFIEVLAVAETSAGANDGYLTWWIDEVEQTAGAVTGVGNIATITSDLVRMYVGNRSGHTATTSGTIYFDHITVTDGQTIGPVSTGISGSLTKSLASLTSSGAGDVLVDASLSKSLAALTSSTETNVLVFGSLAKGLSALTLDGAGVVGSPPISATLNETLANLSVSSAGSVLVSASLAQNLATLVSVASGAILVSGTLTKTLEILSLAASGTISIVGDLDSTLATLVIDASGVVGSSPISATLSKTLGNLTSSGAGTILITGTLSEILDAVTLLASGQAIVAGSLDESLGVLTINADGVTPITGEVLETLGNLVLASAVDIPIVGSLSETLAVLTLDAAGTGVQVTVGSLTKTLGSLTLASTSEVLVDGNLAKTLGALLLSGAGVIPVTGDLTETLDEILLSTLGRNLIQGSLTENLDDVTITVSGNVFIEGVLDETFENVTVTANGLVLSAILGVLDITLDALILLGQAGGAGFGTVTITAVKVNGVTITATEIEGVSITTEEIGGVTITKGLPE